MCVHLQNEISVMVSQTATTNELIDKVIPSLTKLQKSLMAQCAGYNGSQKV